MLYMPTKYKTYKIKRGKRVLKTTKKHKKSAFFFDTAKIHPASIIIKK
jgi:hypothetical protein